MKRPNTRPRALSIAGSDSGGGAGIQADLKTFSALGVFGMTAITAVTVQNTIGVQGFDAISPGTVADQVRAVASDIGVDAAKTGMLANAPIVEAAAPAPPRDQMRRAADAILALGTRSVLVKGGHLEDPARSADLFVGPSWEGWLEEERIDTPNTHGTGCTLSAAIAARLALGDEVPDAVRAAKAFVTEAIRHALTLGGGIGPVDPMWSIRPGRPGSAR
jgi:hydroxymethylpyrimidine/phosphomethylpyrimidine kinase